MPPSVISRNCFSSPSISLFPKISASRTCVYAIRPTAFYSDGYNVDMRSKRRPVMLGLLLLTLSSWQASNTKSQKLLTR